MRGRHSLVFSVRARCRATVAALVVVAVATAGCTSSTHPDSSPRTSETSPSSSSAPPPVAELVGRWQRITSCPELVAGLKQSGLAPLAPYAWLGQTSSNGVDSFANGSPRPSKAHPCAGALIRKHSHFFDQSGKFGSLDWLGGQVDDGKYQIVDSTTLRIGAVDFRYSIKNGNRLTLSPVLNQALKRQALADPQKFSDAGWAVSVAYPGQTWTRVACQGWC
jgi:hypothetical protein